MDAPGPGHFARCASVALALLWVAAATAQPQQFGLQPSEEILVDLSGNPQDADDTALRIKNLSAQSGQVVVDFDPDAGPGPQETVADGFALVDGTLIVTSDLPPGELRARYRIEAGARALREAGIRADAGRMLRLDENTGRWRPAIRALRGRAQVRYLRDARADFVLGHHGFHEADEYVWAVIDVNSQYAAGGSLAAASVPALGPLGLVALGVGLLGAAARMRSAR